MRGLDDRGPRRVSSRASFESIAQSVGSDIGDGAGRRTQEGRVDGRRD